jgi:hypothetical protein
MNCCAQCYILCAWWSLDVASSPSGCPSGSPMDVLPLPLLQTDYLSCSPQGGPGPPLRPLTHGDPISLWVYALLLPPVRYKYYSTYRTSVQGYINSRYTSSTWTWTWYSWTRTLTLKWIWFWLFSNDTPDYEIWCRDSLWTVILGVEVLLEPWNLRQDSLWTMKVDTEIHSETLCLAQRFTLTHYIWRRDSLRNIILHRDSLRTMKLYAEIHSGLWNMSQRFTLDYETWCTDSLWTMTFWAEI